MEDTDFKQPRKNEPGFQTPPPAAEPPVLGDMPAWLKEAPAEPEPRGWARTALWWGGSLAALALVFAGSLWLFEEDPPLQVVKAVPEEPSTAAAQADTAAPKPRSTGLPPLVLLAPAPGAAAGDKPVTAAPAVTTPAPAIAAIKKAEKETPPVAAPAPAPGIAAVKKVEKEKPVLAVDTPKPQAPNVAALPSPARTALEKTKPKVAAAAKKPLPGAKRPTVLAKAKSKQLVGITLPPAREATVEREPERAGPALQCRPGELARECLSRN